MTRASGPNSALGRAVGEREVTQGQTLSPPSLHHITCAFLRVFVCTDVTVHRWALVRSGLTRTEPEGWFTHALQYVTSQGSN